MKLRLLLLLVCFLAAAPAWARTNLEERADVKEAMAVLEQGNYVKARELAEKIVKKEPRNYCACYILGRAFLWGEGSLPRAHFYLSRAVDLIEHEWGERVDSAGPWRTHAMALQDLGEASGMMERYRDELKLLEKYDRLYVPKRPAEHGWPLMKLGRLNESRDRMNEVLRRSQDEDDRTTAYNTLGAIEFEARDVKQSRESYQRLVQEIRSHGWQMDSTFLRNLAEAETMLGNYARAEELLLEATGYENPYSYTNPWGDLAALYLPQGRFSELLSATRRMQAWAAMSAPFVENQTWAERQLTTAEVLLALGYDDVAETLLRRIVYRPDRNMATSSKAYITEAGTLGIYRNVLICRRERLREEMSWCTWRRYFENLTRLATLGQELEWVSERIAALVVAHDGLQWAVQTHQTGSIYGNWLVGDVNNLFGTGVVSAQVKRVLADPEHPTLEVEKPYLGAVLAEGLYLRGRRAAAEAALTGALEEVPPSQRLLHARLQAMLGQVAWQKGQRQQALDHYSKAFEMDAGVFRRLRMRIPARIESSGGPLATRAADYLRSSPRFFFHRDGFVVSLNQGGSGLSGTVLDHRGTRVASFSSPNKKDADETVRAFCARLHEFVFSARLDLSQSDINNLNGSNASSNLAREQLMKSLDMEPPKAPSP
ncbi:MAG: hypothetical protein AB1758_22160 [Candidatus Eremiobacterota bacterium]